MGQWSPFIIGLLLYAVPVNIKEAFLSLFASGKDFFLQLFYHRQECIN